MIIKDSWETIKKNRIDGKHKELYHEGDKKEIVLKNGIVTYATISTISNTSIWWEIDGTTDMKLLPDDLASCVNGCVVSGIYPASDKVTD